MERVEDNSKAQVEQTTARLHDKTAESSSLKLENERLKVREFTFVLHRPIYIYMIELYQVAGYIIICFIIIRPW